MKVRLYSGENAPQCSEEPLTIDMIDSLHDGSCEHIVLDEVLDTVYNRTEALAVVCKKIRYRGKVTVSGIDVLELAKAVSLRTLPVEHCVKALYQGRRSASSVFDMISLFESQGFVIQTKRIDDFMYTLVAKRPDVKND
jgi:hypothetical protein